MLICKPAKLIKLRCTEICKFLTCERSLIYLVEDVLNKTYEETSSEAMAYGTSVHSNLFSAMTGEEVEDKVDIVFNEELIVDRFLRPYKVKNEGQTVTSAEKIYERDGCLISSSPITSKEPLEELPVKSMYDICIPTMFGKELTLFEEHYEYSIKVRNWTVIISGTPDATTEDGSLIVDWKTSASSVKKPSMMHVSYFMQLVIYKLLHSHAKGVPPQAFIGVLAYLVKTKTPKFSPLFLRISPEMIAEGEHLIKRAASACVRFLNRKYYPARQCGMHCSFRCNYSSKCLVGVLPDELSIVEVLFHELNYLN